MSHAAASLSHVLLESAKPEGSKRQGAPQVRAQGPCPRSPGARSPPLQSPCHLFIHHRRPAPGRPASPELPETDSPHSCSSFQLHVAQILKTLRRGRAEEVYFRKLAPRRCRIHGDSRARKTFGTRRENELDLVLISALLGVKTHRTLENYSGTLPFSLVSKGNVHFPTFSRGDRCFLRPEERCPGAERTGQHEAASPQGFQRLALGEDKKDTDSSPLTDTAERSAPRGAPLGRVYERYPQLHA